MLINIHFNFTPSDRPHALYTPVQPPPLVFPTPCTPLYTEQYYSHLAAWAVALRVGAEVVLPPALVKDGQGIWQPTQTDVLLNTSGMQMAAKQQFRMLMHLVCRGWWWGLLRVV